MTIRAPKMAMRSLQTFLKGMNAAERVLVERDRARAIERRDCVDAGPGDAVLIAGKGHEDYQIVGSDKRYFSDRDVVRRALEEACMMRCSLSEIVRVAQRSARRRRHANSAASRPTRAR